MGALTPVLDGVRRRPTAFVGLLVLVTAAVMVSVLSPLLVRVAVQESLARATPAGSLAVVLRERSDAGVVAADPTSLLAPTALWSAHPPSVVASLRAVWQRPPSTTRFAGQLTASPSCRTVTIVEGRCPSRSGEVAVAAGGPAEVGDRLTLIVGFTTTVTVVATYHPGPDGGPFTEAGAAAAERQDGPRTPGSDLLLSPTGLAALDLESVTTVAATLARPLRLEDVATVQRALDRTRSAVERIDGVVGTPITTVLDQQADAQRAGVLVALAVDLQALAVAWAAEAVLVAAVARQRATEWGVARLRGFRLPRRLLAVYAEPMLAVLAGGVVGSLFAVLLARALTSGSAAGVQPLEPIAVLAAGIALAGCVLGLVLASVRSATLPLDRLLRQRTDARRIGRGALVAQSGVLIATVLVVYAAFAGDGSAGGRLPLLAPTLVAVSVGLLGLRLAVAALRGRGGGLPRSVFGLLVVRRLARSPSLLAPAVVVCTATAVAVSAFQVDAVSDRTQAARAAAAVGADRVLTVSSRAGTDLIDAVRRADPSGRRAMAAVEVGSGPQLVAVDTTRLGAVAAWDARWSGRSAAALHRALDPPTRPALRLVGTTVRLDLGQVRTTSPGGHGVPADPSDLRLDLLLDAGPSRRTVPLGTLADASPSAAIPCASGCRVAAFAVTSTRQALWAASFEIDRLRTDRQDPADLAPALSADRWRQDIDTAGLAHVPSVRITTVGGPLRLELQDDDPGTVVRFAPRDGLQPLPVLGGPGTDFTAVAGVPGSAYGVGLGLETLLVRPIGRATVLPRSLADGQLADLQAVRRVSAPDASTARQEVWLSRSATAGTVRALEAQGLRVLTVQHLSTAETAYRRDLVPVVAAQGTIIGMLALLVSLLALLVVELLRREETSAWRTALADAAGSRRVAGLVAVLGTILPALAGAALGLIAGLLGVATVLRLLPLTPASAVVPPVDASIAWSAVLTPLLVAAVLLPVIGVVVAAAGSTAKERE